MSYEATGKIVKIFDIESKTATFQTREFVIEVQSGNYPQMIKFQLTQDRCGLVDNYKQGDEVKVFFDLRGREWNDMYFTNLNAWKIEAASMVQEPVSAPPKEDGSFPTENPFEKSDEFENEAEDFGDLPF